MSDISHDCNKKHCYYCYEMKRLDALDKAAKPIETKGVIKSTNYYKRLLKSA